MKDNIMNNRSENNRLESLDILRGFDLFLLVFIQPIVGHISGLFAPDNWFNSVTNILFNHIEWEGFHPWDMVMPLFLFMTGASIPFAFSKFKKGEVDSITMFKRIFKRVILLWIFGAIVQGNLLDLNIDTLYLYTNTLQSIGFGYLFASLFYMYLPIKGVIITSLILPIIYTIGMQLYGSYLPADNLAEFIDRSILGRFVDGATTSTMGETIFSATYNYAWIYPTINFTTTVLSGVLTGCLLKSKLKDTKKVVYLILIGITCIVLAYALSNIEPIIKKLWTSSMTLLSSGYSILLMALFYYFIDIMKKSKGIFWLKFYGMNSILAYMLYNTLQIDSLLKYWLHGFEQYIGLFYPIIIITTNVIIIFYILRYCYRHSIFLKV